MSQNIFYVYNSDNKIKEIRTRILNHTPPLYVIQKPIQKSNKIQYSVEMVTEKQFYENLVL
jgi:hypothetical protein